MDLGQIIAALSDPSAYPGGADSVEVHQTHISVVFVAGEHAYKIKKPVALGFVDYSTAERRHHFCEEEVRLNRRLAPDVYLGVVPVTRGSSAIRMEGAGEVIDWAVKMRRLPDSGTLRARLAGGIGAIQLEEWCAGSRGFTPRPSRALGLPRDARSNRLAQCPRQPCRVAQQVGVTVSRVTLDRLAARTEWALSRWAA